MMVRMTPFELVVIATAEALLCGASDVCGGEDDVGVGVGVVVDGEVVEEPSVGRSPSTKLPKGPVEPEVLGADDVPVAVAEPDVAAAELDGDADVALFVPEAADAVAEGEAAEAESAELVGVEPVPPRPSKPANSPGVAGARFLIRRWSRL